MTLIIIKTAKQMHINTRVASKNKDIHSEKKNKRIIFKREKKTSSVHSSPYMHHIIKSTAPHIVTTAQTAPSFLLYSHP